MNNWKMLTVGIVAAIVMLPVMGAGFLYALVSTYFEAGGMIAFATAEWLKEKLED